LATVTELRQFALSRLIQRPLCFHSCRDIHAASDVALEFAVLSEERGASIEDPTIDPIVASQTVFHLE
jgi:hypothetical protein